MPETNGTILFCVFTSCLRRAQSLAHIFYTCAQLHSFALVVMLASSLRRRLASARMCAHVVFSYGKQRSAHGYSDACLSHNNNIRTYTPNIKHSYVCKAKCVEISLLVRLCVRTAKAVWLMYHYLMYYCFVGTLLPLMLFRMWMRCASTDSSGVVFWWGSFEWDGFQW